MALAKVVLDTNIMVDFLNERDPYYEEVRLLMLCGRVGEITLCMSASQTTDLIYILSNGGRASELPEVLEKMRGLRTFVEVLPIGEREVDRMLSTSWKDPEDALLFETALQAKADCIITRNQNDFESGLVRALDCEEFFDWVNTEFGVSYDEVDLKA